MPTSPVATRLLGQETRALLTRLARIRPFALYETMVPAAAPSVAAQTAIERYLEEGRRDLRALAREYLTWLYGVEGQRASPSEAQRRFAFLRMRFNLMLSQFDIFADVITQRSENETGVWISGLDVVATDALQLPGGYFKAPPVVCYLDRGHGAAIRRARTRLPGGGDNPVAVVRIPRERMVGSGIASSLVHEVGHQGAEQLDLFRSLRPVLRGLQRIPGDASLPWLLLDRWLTEIVPDFWAAARVGVSAPLGLMGVVSLPRAFVFRFSEEDPHPIPWIRVKLSCALGNGVYPHPQWAMLAEMWEQYYPLDGLAEDKRRLLRLLEATIPAFVTVLLNHRPPALRGRSLLEVMRLPERQPDRLRESFTAWRHRPSLLDAAPPTLVFAVFGQARADGRIGPEEESQLLAQLLAQWAMKRLRGASERCAVLPEQTR